jgi:hypothetical protein
MQTNAIFRAVRREPKQAKYIVLDLLAAFFKWLERRARLGYDATNVCHHCGRRIRRNGGSYRCITYPPDSALRQFFEEDR